MKLFVKCCVTLSSSSDTPAVCSTSALTPAPVPIKANDTEKKSKGLYLFLTNEIHLEYDSYAAPLFPAGQDVKEHRDGNVHS